MSWHKEWQSIQESIEDFSTVCNEHVAALAANRDDSYGTVRNIIIPVVRDIANRIARLRERYQSQLSTDTIDLLKEFTEKTLPFITGFESNNQSAKLPSTVAHFSIRLRRFKSDFNYLTSDLEGTTLRLTARGFSHLQRSIVADESIREKWQTAFNKNEEACESLGSIHLLQHGIWGFKVNSVGERTDLILGEPLTKESMYEVNSSAEGLVLTEWKLASASNSVQKFQEAMNQARLYAKGSLVPLELKRYRYLVAVSENQIGVPDDIVEDGVVYKHINIAVDPLSPSKAAKRKK